MQQGAVVRGLDGFADLSLSELDATDRIVAMAGVHPYIHLLRQGADVIDPSWPESPQAASCLPSPGRLGSVEYFPPTPSRDVQSCLA